jgi:hypothetical protein
MRSETEVRENLEWVKSQCVHFKDDEADRIVRQLEVLLWVLDTDRQTAESSALKIWEDSRTQRGQSPQNY